MNFSIPQIRVRHDSEVQGGGKVAVRGEEVKPTTGCNPMREGEWCHRMVFVETEDLDVFNRDLPMPDQEFEMELEN